MLLEKSENLFELSVKQLVIQSSSVSSIFLSQTMFGVWMLMIMLFLARLGIFHIQEQLFISYSNLKVIINLNHYPKGLSKSFSASYFKKFV